jgi:hypothetical protein
LTGEPFQKPKVAITEEGANLGDACYIFGKSLVVGGSGRCIAVAVGKYSVSGIIEETSSV